MAGAAAWSNMVKVLGSAPARLLRRARLAALSSSASQEAADPLGAQPLCLGCSRLGCLSQPRACRLHWAPVAPRPLTMHSGAATAARYSSCSSHAHRGCDSLRGGLAKGYSIERRDAITRAHTPLVLHAAHCHCRSRAGRCLRQRWPAALCCALLCGRRWCLVQFVV